jgi:hypothetical protein
MLCAILLLNHFHTGRRIHEDVDGLVALCMLLISMHT